ncbi:MAG: diguanylate cyclase domain-containing protein [Cellvibrionaceae bacterium]
MTIQLHGRLTISRRLMLSFAIAALFTLLASGLGIFTFAKSTQSLQIITSQYIPYLSAAHELAVRSRAISSEALNLVNSEYQSSRQSSVNQIDDEFRLMDELIDELKRSNIVDLSTLIKTKEDLLQSYQVLNKIVEGHIEIKRQQKKIRRSIVRLTKQQQKVFKDTEEPLFDESDDEANYVNRLIESVSDIMLTVASVERNSQLKYANVRVSSHLDSVKRILDSSDNNRLINMVTPLYSQWLKIILEDNNLFLLRERELSTLDEIDVRVKIYDRNSKWLVAAAHATIGLVQSKINTSAEETDSKLKRNGVLLILLAVLCVFASVILAIIIGRNIGSRIEMLQYSMDLHAEGKKGLLPTEGDDEIGKMAVAMKKFIDKIDQRENELRKNHLELNANLSELESAQSALKLSEKRFKDFAQVSADWFWEMNADLQFTLLQGNTLDLVGMDPKDIVNKTLSEIISEDDYESIEHHFLTRMSFDDAEFYCLNSRNEKLRFRISGKVLYDDKDNFLGYRGTGSDITQSHELSQKLIHQAHHDALTNLANRIGFERKLNNLIESRSNQSAEQVILYLDLDKFKIVNDTCGHLAGDKLLIDVSKILSDSVRESDLVARLGGDEFGILLENCHLEKAETIANNIVDSISNFHFEWEKHTFRIGVSIGLAALSSLPQNMIKVIRAVDSACYQAKETGRNRVCVYTSSVKGKGEGASKDAN